MDGYEVEIAALRTAADAADSAGQQVREVKAGAAVTEVPAARPGSGTTSAITDWAETFDLERLEAWAAAAIEHGRRLTESADLYAENEEAAAAAFGSQGEMVPV